MSNVRSKVLGIGMSLGVILTVAACQSERQTQDLIQARFDAEKLKELSQKADELKEENIALRNENKLLTTELMALKLKVSESSGSRVTAAKTAEKAAVSTQAAAAELSQTRKAVTGGGSFK